MPQRRPADWDQFLERVASLQAGNGVSSRRPGSELVGEDEQETPLGLPVLLVTAADVVDRRPSGLGQDVADHQPGGSAAVVEGHLVAVRVRERERAAERPVGGR